MVAEEAGTVGEWGDAAREGEAGGAATEGDVGAEGGEGRLSSDLPRKNETVERFLGRARGEVFNREAGPEGGKKSTAAAVEGEGMSAKTESEGLDGAIVGGREAGAREGVVRTGRGDGFVGEGRPRAGERRTLARAGGMTGGRALAARRVVDSHPGLEGFKRRLGTSKATKESVGVALLVFLSRGLGV